MSYKIVQARTLGELQDEVQSHLDRDWKLQGSVVVNTKTSLFNFFQVMTMEI